MQRLHLIVSGEVQGVGFRWFAREVAMRIGVSGFARNLKSGEVEIEVQGNDEHLHMFIEYIAQGPSRAVVTSVKKTPVELQPHETGFNIER